MKMHTFKNIMEEAINILSLEDRLYILRSVKAFTWKKILAILFESVLWHTKNNNINLFEGYLIL